MRYANKNMGVPINPYRHAEKSLWSEFWQDFLSIFVTGFDGHPVGAVISVAFAAFFVVQWGLFLVGMLFKMNVKKPEPKRGKAL